MQNTLKILGLIALGLTIIPPALFFAGSVTLPTVKWVMAVGCLLWFGTAPFFMKAGSE